MRIALVGPELEENLGLRYLAASLAKAGHEARIFDFHAPDQVAALVRGIGEYAPQVVGLSMVFTARAREYVCLADALRSAGYRGHVTAGGHFASFHADALLAEFPSLDSIVHGEGEEALVDLVDHLADLESVLGLTYRGAGGCILRTRPRANPDDLDSKPWPVRPEAFQTYLGLPIANVLASRGCFGQCDFCSIQAWYRQNAGPRFRQRRPERVAEEVAALYHERGVRIFNFHDDNFFLPEAAANVERFRDLARRLDALGVGRIAIQVKARPDSVTPEVMAALVDLGLFRVFLGVESNAVAGLKALGRGIAREQNHAALQVLRGLGLHVSFNLLMFEPDATPADLADNVAMIRRYADVPLNFGRVEVYSGTPLEARLRAQGRLIGDYFGFYYRIADERVQQAFEIYRRVFTPRNFDAGAMNLEAMRVDYTFHLLRHFYPGRAGRPLKRKVKGAIRRLNGNSADLLDRIVAFAAEGRSDAEAARFAEDLKAERAAFDARHAKRFASLLAETRRGAEPSRADRVRLGPAASAAAAVLLVTAAGCDNDGTHSTEMAPQSPAGDLWNGSGTNAASLTGKDLSEAQGATVKARIESRYKLDIMEVALNGEYEKEQVVVVRLALGAGGDVKGFELKSPSGFRGTAGEKVLKEKIRAWAFPEVREAGCCTVELRIPPSQTTHMFEKMAAPMENRQ
jgi:radical SAM superfamily enzyme YgiQ (UPF0313 family)